MENVKWKVDTVIDCHVHFDNVEPIPHFYDNIDLISSTKSAILGLPPGNTSNQRILDLKKDRPEQFFIFGHLVHKPEFVEKGDGSYLAEQAERFMAAGFDGIKMLEGKPTQRVTYAPHPFDHEYYRPFWEYVTEHSIPVTLHLADSTFRWDHDRPDDAYCGGAPFEEYMREGEAILETYPGLKISFAHFMFLSLWLDRLDDLFTRFPEMRVDLAMGSEYLYAISRDPEEGHDFFVKWQERIIYGTDLNDRNSSRLAHAKGETIRRFLETDQVFPSLTLAAQDQEPKVIHGRSDFQGLNLPIEVLENILHRNFEKFAGKKPKSVPPDASI
ncbi:amidohydrolase family protein [Planctomycetota bacterium]